MNSWEEEGPSRIKEKNCNVFNVTDFSTLKNTKSEDYRCFNFLFLFVTPYLTSLFAARRLILPKTNKKNTEKQTKKKENKQLLDFWFSLHTVGIKKNFLFAAIDFFFMFTSCCWFPFCLITTNASLFFSFCPRRSNWPSLAGSCYMVSTVWCIRLLSALAQTCGPFLLNVLILCFYKTKQTKKRFYIHLKSSWHRESTVWYLAWAFFCLHS